jgi:hypothetical protein
MMRNASRLSCHVPSNPAGAGRRFSCRRRARGRRDVKVLGAVPRARCRSRSGAIRRRWNKACEHPAVGGRPSRTLSTRRSPGSDRCSVQPGRNESVFSPQ